MDYRRALLIFISLVILTEIAGRLMFIIIPMWLLERSFSATEVGLIFSAGAVALIAGRFLVAKLSDRWGRKNILVAGLFTSSVSTAVYPSSSTIYEYAAAKSGQDIGSKLYGSVEDAMIGDRFKEKERTRVLSILGTAMPVGRAIAMVIGIAIAAYISISYGFYVAAACLFVAGVIFLLFYKEKGFIKTKSRVSTFHGVNKPILLLSLVMVCNSLCFTIAYAPAFFVLSKSLGLAEADLFSFYLISYIISSFFAWRTASWIRRHGKERMLALTSLSFGLFTLFYAAATSSVLILVVALMCVAISYYVWNISYKNVLLDVTEDGKRGEQIGFTKLISDIGYVAGPIIGGLLIDNVSLQSAFLVAGSIGMLGGIFALSLRKIK